MNKFKNFLYVLLPVVFVAFGFYFKTFDEREDVLMHAITENLGHYHYDPVSINDAFSEKAYEQYLDNIDPNRRLLLQSDVETLSNFRQAIDDQVKEGNYDFFDKSYKILNNRIALTEEYFTDILSKPFDFSKNEKVLFAKDPNFAKSEKELKERWRKYLKHSVLTRLYSDVKAQEKASENPDTTLQILSIDSLETRARKSVLKTHTDWYKRLKRLKRKDRLASYVNSITTLYDPHTNYFPPKDKENFDIAMSGRLEGIGAQLQEKDGYIKITRIIPGGPASLQGDLKANDLILKVAQEKEEAVDIVDWRIDDAVKLIRGKKGSKVTLTVRKPDASVQEVTITRDVVVLEETYAKSLILSDADQKKAGYILLPSFYADFNRSGGRTSWEDVKKEVEKLKKEKVSGIVIDLRDNGGGSLHDVVKMAGLFIDKGPVVQVKEKNRSPHVMKDYNAGAQWEGPLVIMVNEFSASASEILAAALQDYNRAIVLGSSSTHGKGTVQRFLALNQTLRSKNIPDLGSIKLTTQKFYRINGDATQLKGVNADVVAPDNYMYIKTGEKEHDYPLEWDQIESSEYDATRYSIDENIIKNSQKRVNSNAVFALVEENARRWEEQRNEEEFNLNFDIYKSEQEKEEERNTKYENIFKEIETFDVLNPSTDKSFIAEEESRVKRNEEWISKVKKDPYIYEALQIIEEWK